MFVKIFALILLSLTTLARAHVLMDDGEQRNTLVYRATKSIPNQPTRIIYFSGQTPKDPGIYDAAGNFANLAIVITEPEGGVTTETGLLINAPGVTWSLPNLPYAILPITDWPTRKNVAVATIWCRNAVFPADFSKLQLGDLLRAVAIIRQNYPQYNWRRQYLWGGSGAGWALAQLYAYCPEQWAEVYLHCGIMKLTTSSDVQTNYPADAGGLSWNINTGFPEQQNGLSSAVWIRYQAERTLRGPLWIFQNPKGLEGRLLGPNAALVAMFHGTADDTVDHYHMTSVQLALETYTKQKSILRTSDNSQERRELQNWSFIDVKGQGHYYDRGAVTESNFPNCFTKALSKNPPVAIDYISPLTDSGYAFHLSGSLEDPSTIKVETIQVTAVEEGWQLYE